ncbi:MAG: glycosyltransferase family 2 protein [Acidobacteriia bacterium]|nr:glycosyltransferase family 2 protein [Terriglobia bacterium]
MRTDCETDERPNLVSDRGVSSPASLRLALITPARNEAQFVELTIQSVIAQSVRPVRWVIVSDGSTDGTDEIVTKYAAENLWIELVRMPERQERNFAGKVHAFRAGYARIPESEYDVIGNLDADITFDERYFEFLLRKFADNPRLGVAGTPFQDESVQYNYSIVSNTHVSGACQLFRRQCFEEIGGYIPSMVGGIDLLAVTNARMKGWQTKAFLEKTCIHHRKMGSAKHGSMLGAFKGGQGDYALGCDPLWQLLRCIYRLGTLKPFVLNGSLCLAGFLWAAVSRAEKIAPPELVRFRRSEERFRLRNLLKSAIPWNLHRTSPRARSVCQSSYHKSNENESLSD